MTTTYTRLRQGDWGLRLQVGSQERIETGDRVSVSKRDGSVKTEYVGRVIWRSEDGRTVLATIAQSARSSRPATRRMGPGRGLAAQVPGYASYCTDNDSCRCFDCAS